MSAMQSWVLSVVCCALLTGFAARLSSGAAQGAVRFTGGLLLTLCLLAPLRQLEPEELLPWREYREAVEEVQGALEEEERSALAEGIGDQLGAYIEDKAGLFGLSVEAKVTVTLKGGVPVPQHAELRGDRSDALADWIEEELAIPKERQVWTQEGKKTEP